MYTSKLKSHVPSVTFVTLSPSWCLAVSQFSFNLLVKMLRAVDSLCLQNTVRWAEKPCPGQSSTCWMAGPILTGQHVLVAVTAGWQGRSCHCHIGMFDCSPVCCFFSGRMPTTAAWADEMHLLTLVHSPSQRVSAAAAWGIKGTGQLCPREKVQLPVVGSGCACPAPVATSSPRCSSWGRLVVAGKGRVAACSGNSLQSPAQSFPLRVPSRDCCD